MTTAPQATSWKGRVAGGASTLVSTGWPLAALVGIFVVIDRIVQPLTDLGESGYRASSLTLELMRSSSFAILALVGLWAVVVWRTKSFALAWPKFNRGWSLRLPVGAAVVLLTWWFSAYEYNLFFEQGHWLDRGVLIVLGAATIWRPVFIVPWLLLLTTIMQQFNYPIGGYSVAESYQLVRAAELFLAAMVVRLVTGRWRIADFLVVLFSLVASGYFVPGLGKARLGWLQIGAHIETNLVGGYAGGWLSGVSAEAVSSIARTVGVFAWPLLIATAILELGAVFILWGRRVLVGFLCVFIAFHTGVTLLTGISFWRWIAFEAVLLAFLLKDNLIADLPIFTWAFALISTVLVLAAPLWARPVNLAWLDAPVGYSYRLIATDAAGETGELDAGFFQPYGYQFAIAAFDYTSSDTLLPPYGGTLGNRDALHELYDASTPEEVFEIEASTGLARYDEAKTAGLDRFLSAFVGNWNKDGEPPQVWTFAQGPPQVLTFARDPYTGPGPIETVEVWRVMWFWNGDTYEELRSTKVHEVEIQSLS